MNHQRQRLRTNGTLAKMEGNLNENGQESYRKRLTVPSGFRNLLEGLTVEILRSNPSDVYTFAAEHFKSRLQERQVRGYDDCLLGSQIDGYYRYEPFRGNREELDEAAAKIQATFRGHKARKEVQKRKSLDKQAELAQFSTSEKVDSFGGNEHEAATRIQACYRGYNTRKELRARNEAATTIQAGYRGYMARKGLKEKIDGKPDLPTIDEDDAPGIKQQEACKGLERHEEEEAAAIKIQSAFRGHRTRKAAKNAKEGVDSGQEGNESVLEDPGPAANEIEHDAKHDDAATKIQSSYRGYYTRKQLEGKRHAATKIQACYRGHRVRKLRRTQSEAAVKIQSYYRGYKTRDQLKKRHSTGKNFLMVSSDNEFALHRDSRTSFSLPEGVKFEGTLDEDSDTEIDKMVDDLQAKQGLKAIEEATSPDQTNEKGES